VHHNRIGVAPAWLSCRV